MSEAPGLKLTIVGPSGSGKSTLSNFLSGSADNLTAPTTYTPTIGVRILECEKEVGSSSVPVEIWDVGGSTDFENCWPAIMNKSHGAVLVYSPENDAHVGEVGAWYDYFVKKNELDDDQCIVFAFTSNPGSAAAKRPSPKLSNLNVINITAESGPFTQQQFEKFLVKVNHKKSAAP